jgi:predicted XRE-type DNA-binding protein
MAQKARKKVNTSRKKSTATLRRDSIPRTLLAREVRKRIQKFGLSRHVAAIVVGDAASQMSRLMTGYARDFSADRLVGFLLRLGSDVTITIRHSPRLSRRGRVRVVVH